MNEITRPNIAYLIRAPDAQPNALSDELKKAQAFVKAIFNEYRSQLQKVEGDLGRRSQILAEIGRVQWLASELIYTFRDLLQAEKQFF